MSTSLQNDKELAPIVDTEMKEDGAPEIAIESIPPSDPTDPNPPPQPAAVPSMPAAATPEYLSAHQPTASGNSTRPNSMPPLAARPDKAVAHGGPTRQFLNQKITPHLLEGMKHLAVHEPEKPLLWLADFLRERSHEVEG